MPALRYAYATPTFIIEVLLVSRGQTAFSPSRRLSIRDYKQAHARLEVLRLVTHVQPLKPPKLTSLITLVSVTLMCFVTKATHMHRKFRYVSKL